MSFDLHRRRILVTGATGYIGGELVQPLLDSGADVRVLARDKRRLRGRPWRHSVDICEGDAGSDDDLDRALEGIDTAYYLVHSMEGGEFAERDHAMATAFSEAAARAGVRRIVYLGGMHPTGELSEHLESRADVGRVFLEGPVPAVVLQAAVVLGAGSASFDMLRYLSGRLPVVIAPKWLRNRLQPIAVDDVVHYLLGAATLDGDVNRTFDVGGPEVLSYAELMQRFATVTGRSKRVIVTVPLLTPELASLWVGLVTPVDTGVARPLVGSLVNEVVAQEQDIRELLPKDGGLTGLDEALRTAENGLPRDTGPRNLALTSAAVAATALAGSLATDPGSRWYRRLDKPAWQPPKLAFPIAWTSLYADIVLASAAALTTLEREGKHGDATGFRRELAANLALNTAWSAVFFRAHRPAASTVVSAALAGSAIRLARRAGATRTRRGWALAPYAAWSAFATALSGEIARRNR